MNKYINKIKQLFNNETSEIYICRICGHIGKIQSKDDELGCEICGHNRVDIYDWLDFILDRKNIKKSILLSQRSNNIYNRRTKVRLKLNVELIDKIKLGLAEKTIYCQVCNGNGHDKYYIPCDVCYGTGVVKINKHNYLKYVKGYE